MDEQIINKIMSEITGGLAEKVHEGLSKELNPPDGMPPETAKSFTTVAKCDVVCRMLDISLGECSQLPTQKESLVMAEALLTVISNHFDITTVDPEEVERVTGKKPDEGAVNLVLRSRNSDSQFTNVSEPSEKSTVVASPETMQ